MIVRTRKIKASAKFKTLYCDPPWNETGGGVKGGRRGADKHYPLMKVSEIAALPVSLVMEENSHCYLWVTNTFLCSGAGFEVMKAWGFTPKTLITWGKTQANGQPAVGIGQYFRGASEHCIFGVRGCLPYKIDAEGKRCQSTTLLLEGRTTHSTKPESMIERIEKVSYPNYLELFARPNKQPRKNWTYCGNETSGNDVVADLTMLHTLGHVIPKEIK